MHVVIDACIPLQAAMGRDVMSYLIMPIQRVPRYELLLRELLKNSSEQDPAVRTSGQQALDKIVSINQAGTLCGPNDQLVPVLRPLNAVSDARLLACRSE